MFFNFFVISIRYPFLCVVRDIRVFLVLKLKATFRKKDSVFPQALNSFTYLQLSNEDQSSPVQSRVQSTFSNWPLFEHLTSLGCRTGAILLRFSGERKPYVERETRGERCGYFSAPRPLCVHLKNAKKKTKQKQKTKKQCLFCRLESHTLITLSNFSKASSSPVCSSFNDFYVLAEFLHRQH